MTVPNGFSRKPAKQKSAEAGGRKRGGHGCIRCWTNVTGLLIAAFGVAGLVLYRQYGLDVNLHNYHDGDQVLARKTTSDLNSVLCESYTVETVGTATRASVYLTDGPAKISPNLREIIAIQNSGLNSHDEFDYRAFYLLPGSDIEVLACMSIFNRQPRIQAEVVFIKGDKHFNRWKDDPNCDRCVEHRITVPGDTLCETSSGVMARYVISDEDTYYVIITRQHRSDDDVAFRADVEVRVTRTMYDLSDVKEQCLRTSSCRLNLTYNSDDDVIVQYPSALDSYPGYLTAFTTECTLRRSFWLAVFIIPPSAMLGLLMFLCCVGCCANQGPNKQQPKQKQVKKPAVREVFTVPTNEEDTKPLSYHCTTPPV